MNKFIVISEQINNENQTHNTRIFTNKPEIRYKNIYDKLSSLNYNIIANTTIISLLELEHLFVHNRIMLKFFKNCINSYTDFYFHLSEDNTFGNFKNGIIPYNIIRNANEIINNDQLLNQMACFKQIGLFATDQITPIFENTYSQMLSSASNGFVAPKYIIDGYNRIYCLNLNPGHHASYNSYGGYCYLNNGAICAKSLLTNSDLNYKNIAILDLDYHAGDGTTEIFKDNKNVLTISIHMNPIHDYPFYSSFEESNEDKEYYNFCFEPKCDLEQYLNLIKKSMNIIYDFEPDALIIAFGGDTYENDLDALEHNRTKITINDYKIISSTIEKLWNSQKPIIVTQEGGYNMNDIAEIVNSFLSGFMEND